MYHNNYTPRAARDCAACRFSFMKRDHWNRPSLFCPKQVPDLSDPEQRAIEESGMLPVEPHAVCDCFESKHEQQPEQLPVFTVAVTWQSSGTYQVPAKSLDEAIKIVNAADKPAHELPQKPVYVDDSMDIDMSRTRELNPIPIGL